MSRSRWFIAFCLTLVVASAMAAGFVWGAHASLVWVLGNPVATLIFFVVFYVAPIALLAYAIRAIAKRK